MQAQALGLAEAAGLCPELRVLAPRAPWKWVAASMWPAPLAAVPDAVRAPLPELVIGCGGMAAAVGSALRRVGGSVVQVQHPRMDPRRFDVIVVNRQMWVCDSEEMMEELHVQYRESRSRKRR